MTNTSRTEAELAAIDEHDECERVCLLGSLECPYAGIVHGVDDDVEDDDECRHAIGQCADCADEGCQ